MIKRFVILRKKPSMSVEDFRHYWENVHGPLIGKIPGVTKYIQYHVRSDNVDHTEPSIDGIAELWFESEESQVRAWQTPEYQAVVEDEPNLFNETNLFVHPVMTDKVVVIKDV